MVAIINLKLRQRDFDCLVDEAVAQGRTTLMLAIARRWRELSPAEAAIVLRVSVPFMVGLLDAGEITSTGTGADRRVQLSDLIAHQVRRSSDNRHDLATALAVAQEAGAYD